MASKVKRVTVSIAVLGLLLLQGCFHPFHPLPPHVRFWPAPHIHGKHKTHTKKQLGKHTARHPGTGKHKPPKVHTPWRAAPKPRR